jgi:hypothetical protein
MKLKNVFRRIHANSANVFHRRSPLAEICNDLFLAHRCLLGAVHPNRFGKRRSDRFAIFCQPLQLLGETY